MEANYLAFLLAAGAGMVSFLSPCVLPLVPTYIAFLAGGASPGPRYRTLGNGILFVAGFTAVFVLFGLTAGAVGQWLSMHAVLLRRLGGVLVFVLGLYMMGISNIAFLDRERRFHWRPRQPGPLNAFLLGTTFSAGWTPCIGPALGSILVLAGSTSTAVQGGLLLVAYAMGLAVPFLAVTVTMHRTNGLIRRLMPHTEKLRIAGGALFAGLGIMMYTNVFVTLNALFVWRW